MKKKNSFHVVGISMIMVVLLVLSLLVFGSLSLVSAKADYNMSKEYANDLSKYYDANSKVQEILKNIEKRLEIIYKDTGIENYLNAALNDVNLNEIGETYLNNGEVFLK